MTNLRWYIDRGIPLFPLYSVSSDGDCDCQNGSCPSPGKHPRTASSFKDATVDIDQVGKWAARWPNLNIGIPTGAKTGFVVLDVDPRHGGDESLEKLQNLIGTLPKTWTVLTGGGGLHFYFTYPSQPIGNKAGILPGLDIRGDGGYVVAPPSLHVSGRKYLWDVGAHPDEIQLATLPPKLMELISHPKRSLNGSTTASNWKSAAIQTIPEGKRNSTVASLAGHLLFRHVDPHVSHILIQSFNKVRCRPPLTESEVTAVVESIAKAEHRRRKGGK